MLETSPDVELVESPIDRVKGDEEAKDVQLCSTGFSDNTTQDMDDGGVTLINVPSLHTVPIAESIVATMLDHVGRAG